MPATVQFIKDEALIRVQESGTLLESEFFDSVLQIFEIHRSTGCSRVLVDARRQSSITEGFQAFNRGSLAAAKLASTGIRLAVIVNSRLADGHSFFETVSRNRGLTVQVFLEEEAAREWLDA